MNELAQHDAAVDISDLVASETAILDVMKPGGLDPSGWKVTFAGPDHPQTVEAAKRAQRRQLAEQRLIDQQRANGRRVKIEAKEPDDENRRAVESIVDRIVTWTPVRIGGTVYDFEPKSAVNLLLRPSMSWAFGQMVDFLVAERSFLPNSASN